MIFKIWIGRVVNMFVLVTTQVTIQMHSVQMLEEYHVVKVVFLAEITPGMWQDLGLLVITDISELNVIFQVLNIVQLLFSNEN